MIRPRIALVVPNLAGGGGVPAVARFLVRVIERSGEFGCGLVSLATSARDEASLRLASPRSWIGKPEVNEGTWEGRRVRHVGARFVELEFQRYRPRSVLSRLLREFDLVQVVAGSPAVALVARDFPGPVALQVATLAAAERRERSRRESGPLGVWRRGMTAITNRVERRGVAVADRIFVENEWMRGKLAEWTDPDRVVLAPPGVDTEFFHTGACATSRNGQVDYILSVGRFADPRKSVGLLFDAYARLRARVPACPPLVLAGESLPAPREQERLRELRVEDSVSFLGKVSRERLAELYRGAALFVLSSAEEGLGMVLLEAMSSGVPVVTTRTQGAIQVVEDRRSGLLTPVGDARSLAGAMERLLTDPPFCSALGRQARSRVEQRFSEAAAGQTFLDAYRELLLPGGEPGSVRSIARTA